jgi:hypothetical protein
MTPDNAHRETRPPGWWETIDKAIADASEPNPESVERVAALLAPALRKVLQDKQIGNK